jgi:hypothetical protein
MSESKHTPGAWEYGRMLLPPKARDRRCGFVVNGPDLDSGDLPVRICDIRAPRGVNGFAEAEANARLIAAAPKLLEAMVRLFDHCSMVHKHWGDGCNRKEAEVAIQDARAAIYAATEGDKVRS